MSQSLEPFLSIFTALLMLLATYAPASEEEQVVVDMVATEKPVQTQPDILKVYWA